MLKSEKWPLLLFNSVDKLQKACALKAYPKKGAENMYSLQ